MVGICKGSSGDLNSLLPIQTFNIHQQSQQLYNGYGRVSIVQLNGYFLWESVEVGVLPPLKSADYILEGGRSEEILLLQSQLLSFLGMIGGIQNTACMVGWNKERKKGRRGDE